MQERGQGYKSDKMGYPKRSFQQLAKIAIIKAINHFNSAAYNGGDL